MKLGIWALIIFVVVVALYFLVKVMKKLPISILKFLGVLVVCSLFGLLCLWIYRQATGEYHI